MSDNNDLFTSIAQALKAASEAQLTYGSPNKPKPMLMPAETTLIEGNIRLARYLFEHPCTLSQWKALRARITAIEFEVQLYCSPVKRERNLENILLSSFEDMSKIILWNAATAKALHGHYGTISGERCYMVSG